MAQEVMSGPAAPAVSVCIANYNGMDVIDACLESVLSQDFALPVEIVVHDDASTDGSLQHIRDKYPGVILIESEHNVGFCVSNNRMAQIARGACLLLLNNDAELLPDALRTLHQAANALRQPAVLGLPQFDASTNTLIDRGSLFDPFLNPIPNLDPARRDVGMVIGACLWIPRPLWQQLGGFPEWFGSMAEDMYLCCLARLRGCPVQVLPDSGFRHWVGHSFGGGKVLPGMRLATSVKRRTLSERNKSFVMVLTYPAPLFYLLFPLHLSLLLLEGILLAVLKRDASLWRAIYLGAFRALWQERKRLRTLRCEIQRTRQQPRLHFFRIFTVVPYKIRMLFRHGLPHIS
jgi:GT2 family glycosyltransferase